MEEEKEDVLQQLRHRKNQRSVDQMMEDERKRRMSLMHDLTDADLVRIIPPLPPIIQTRSIFNPRPLNFPPRPEKCYDKMGEGCYTETQILLRDPTDARTLQSIYHKVAPSLWYSLPIYPQENMTLHIVCSRNL